MNSSNTIKIWIFALMAVLILILILLYIQYSNINASLSSHSIIWNFIGSDQFQIIFISLFLPILLLFIGQLFNINVIVFEKIQKEKQNKINEQIICYNELSEIVSEMNDIINQIKYFQNNDDILNNNLLHRLDSEVIRFTHLIHLLNFRFDKISTQTTNAIIFLFSILINSSISIIFLLRNKHDNKRNITYKNYLEIIQQGFLSFFHDRILEVININIEINKSNDISERNKLDIKLKESIQQLYKWKKAFARFNISQTSLILNKTYKNNDKYRDSFNSILEEHIQKPKEQIYQLQNFNDYIKELLEIPVNEKLEIINLKYDSEHIKKIVNQFTVEIICKEIFNFDEDLYKQLKKESTNNG